MNKISDIVYCAFCKLERRAPLKKDASWTNVLVAIMGAMLTQFIFFQNMDGRVVVLTAVYLFVAQIFIRMRWRLSMPCTHCGFDPVLYKTDREQTVRQVREHLSQLRESGQHLMKSQNPFEHLPKRKATPTNGQTISNPQKESMLSRRV